mmetsp:Transcript_370/g.1198  ORF Transcript_370/g.1198 Transcript_370/m.1198 type:complete len:368 (+) Transcript_370:145-1248(+)
MGRIRLLLDLPDALIILICEKFDSVSTLGAFTSSCSAILALVKAGIPTAWRAIALQSGDIPLTIMGIVTPDECHYLLRAVHQVRALLAQFTPQPAGSGTLDRLKSPRSLIPRNPRCPLGAMPMSPPVLLLPRDARWLHMFSRFGQHFLHLERGRVLHLHDEAGRCLYRSRVVRGGTGALAYSSRLRPPQPPPTAMMEAVQLLQFRSTIASRIAVLDISSNNDGISLLDSIKQSLAPFHAAANDVGRNGQVTPKPRLPDQPLNIQEIDGTQDRCASKRSMYCDWDVDSTFVFVSGGSWPRNLHGVMPHVRDVVTRSAASQPPRRVLIIAPSDVAALVIRNALVICIFTQVGGEVNVQPSVIPSGACSR